MQEASKFRFSFPIESRTSRQNLEACSSTMEGDHKITKDDVIAKIKDDGDFDRLRLKIIRKLKDNEEIRDKIISVVKQSVALNRAGAENLKPRQLSDAIHEEVGEKIMGHLSDGLWEIIRSDGGMKSEIRETVKFVYNKMVNPTGKEDGKSPYPFYGTATQKESDNNGSLTTLVNEDNDTLSDSEPKEPPGFTLCDHNQENCEKQHIEELQLPLPHEKSPAKELREEPYDLHDELKPDGVQSNMPPSFPVGMEPKLPNNDSDEDPDVPPGFG